MLVDPALLHSPLFTLLSAFVMINTVMFLALAVAKMLPKVYVSDWFTSRNRRAESRGIYPETPESPRGVGHERPGGPDGGQRQPGPGTGRTAG
jgi:hypothetical protein